eukprot:353568-Chlamydomonas_euryale.AAC.6
MGHPPSLSRFACDTFSLRITHAHVLHLSNAPHKCTPCPWQLRPVRSSVTCPRNVSQTKFQAVPR